MRIKKIDPIPYEKSIFPGISFDVEIGYTKYQEAIVGISGWVETDDGKIIAEVREDVPDKTKYCEVGARQSHFDKEFKEDVHKTTLVALLDRRALNHIEKRRMEDRKGDVKLSLNLIVKIVHSRTVISHVHEIKPEDIGLESLEIYAGRKTRDWNFLVYAYDPEYSSRTNKWLLSSDGKPIFLTIYEQSLKGTVRIPSTDWIHDYAPKLELGEYFIVEMPKGKEIIKEAWRYIEKAEECFRRWDTKGVYANCREVGYLLDRIIKEKFGKDNFNYKERWGRAYGRFEHLTSLDLHLEQLKQKQQYMLEEIKIGKDDAEHILTVTKLLTKYAEELVGED